MKKYFVTRVVLILIAAQLLACVGSADSHSSAVTPPDGRVVNNIESFWLYEANEKVNDPWEVLQTEGINYFPIGVPTTLQDFIWTADYGIKMELVVDRFQRHANGKIPRINFSVGQQGRRVDGLFVHDLFENLNILPESFEIVPTFELSGKIGDQLEAIFEISNICFSINEATSSIDLKANDLSVYKKTFEVTRANFETEQFTLDANYDSEKYKKFFAKCPGLDIVSSFSIHLRASKVNGTFAVEFPGIHVKKQTSGQ